ncbi:MAG: ABC transporter substrate-binding protein [Ktedonobacterales bacterium]
MAHAAVMRLALDGMGANDLGALDPGAQMPLAQGSDAFTVASLVFDALVTLDASARPELWGADALTITPDGRIYTFHLRPGQRFSDGTSVRASDYTYAMDRLLNPCYQAYGSFLLWSLKDAQAYSNEVCMRGAVVPTAGQAALTTLVGDAILPDDSAGLLTLLLAHPAAYLLPALASGRSFALERRVVSGANLGQDATWTGALTHGPTGQGGSGMFYVAEANAPDGSLVLKANPYWWGIRQHKQPWLKELDIQVNAFGAAEALTSGIAYDYVEAHSWSGGLPWPAPLTIALPRGMASHSVLLLGESRRAQDGAACQCAHVLRPSGRHARRRALCGAGRAWRHRGAV